MQEIGHEYFVTSAQNSDVTPPITPTADSANGGKAHPIGEIAHERSECLSGYLSTGLCRYAEVIMKELISMEYLNQRYKEKLFVCFCTKGERVGEAVSPTKRGQL